MGFLSYLTACKGTALLFCVILQGLNAENSKPDVIRNLIASNITTSSVFLEWEEPSGYRSYFKVKWINDETEKNITTHNTSYNITELTPGVKYTFVITAVAGDSAAEGDPVVISIYIKPDVIKDLTVSNITTSSVLLKWEEPSGNRSIFKVQWIGDKTERNIITDNTSHYITELTPGVNYTFIITALAGDNSTEGDPVVISIYTKPDVIQNLIASEITTTSVFLQWEEPSGNRSYFTVQWTGDKTNTSITYNTSYNITGLTPGVTYTFSITAVARDSSTEGDPVVISNFTNVIKDLTASEITTSSVFLQWDEPYGNRSNFKVQWIGDKTVTSITNNTSYNVTGLTPGVNYTFIITAVVGENLKKGHPIVISNFTKPDVIKNLTVSNITTSSVLLKWEEPSGNRSYFKVQWIGDKTERNITTDNTSHYITELTPGVNYTFSITAVAGDNSTEGDPVVISIYTKPDVIQNLIASEITTSSVFLQWEEPSGNRSYFKVQWTGDKTNTSITYNTSYNITGLTPGVTYTFSITAVARDSSTEGDPVVISNFTNVIKDLTVSNITTSSVFLQWDEPSGNRSNFKVQWIGDKTGIIITNNTSYNVTGLTPGVKYAFIITAVVGENLTKGHPIVISNFTKPDVIKNLTVSNITTSSVLLKWEEPSGNRSYFKVKWIGDKTEKNITTDNTSHNITELTPGVNYMFIITAVAGDNSTEGDPVVISIYTKPDVIKNLIASNITSSSVFLKWDEPSGNRSYFKVQWIGDKTETRVTNNTSYNIPDLTPGVNYTFSITAVAGDDLTEGDPVFLSKCTKPDVTMNLTASEITTSSVLLKWEEPLGNRSYFKVQWIGDKREKNITTDNLSLNITELTPGVNYTFIITAVAACNLTEGDPVVISNCTKPDVIKDLTVSNITTSSVFLQWKELSGSRSYFKVQWISDKTERNLTTDNTFYNITGLTPGVNYTFIITAVAECNLTEGDPVVISDCTKPDVIKNLTVSNITTSSVLLEWEEPSGNRSYFKVQWISDKTKGNITTDNTSYNITELTPGVNYTFIITAVAECNLREGDPVVISDCTKPDVIKNLTVSNITTSSVLLEWEEPSGNRSYFKVQWISDKTKGNITTDNTSYNITELTPGVNYTFIITAVAECNLTEGDPVVISDCTKPDVIRDLTVSNITTSSVFLKWKEPSGNRSYFKVQWIGDKREKNITTHNTSHYITELTPGVNYTFIITAVAECNLTGDPVVISDCTKPDVIKNLTVSEITTSSVLLNWEEPSGNRSYFKVQWISDKTKGNITTNNLSLNITGLTPGVTNTFSITAVAECNLTEGDPVVISDCTKPDVIKDLTVSEITTSSVLLKWEEPSGNRSYFKVKWISDKTERNITTHNTFYNITELTPGVNYTFSITAVAGCNLTGDQVVISNCTIVCH
nr:fibronectin [Misgurnus anguillicaudatus]